MIIMEGRLGYNSSNKMDCVSIHINDKALTNTAANDIAVVMYLRICDVIVNWYVLIQT